MIGGNCGGRDWLPAGSCCHTLAAASKEAEHAQSISICKARDERFSKALHSSEVMKLWLRNFVHRRKNPLVKSRSNVLVQSRNHALVEQFASGTIC